MHISVFILLVYLTGTVHITVNVPGLACWVFFICSSWTECYKVALKTKIKCKLKMKKMIKIMV